MYFQYCFSTGYVNKQFTNTPVPWVDDKQKTPHVRLVMMIRTLIHTVKLQFLGLLLTTSLNHFPKFWGESYKLLENYAQFIGTDPLSKLSIYLRCGLDSGHSAVYLQSLYPLR